MKSEVNANVCIMQTVPNFDYLVKVGETLEVNELRARVLFCPAIMDEPELQIMSQVFNECTISSVTRNNAGYWWDFKTEII